jgi:hypothetical protein
MHRTSFARNRTVLIHENCLPRLVFHWEWIFKSEPQRAQRQGFPCAPSCPLWLAFVVGACPIISFPQLGPMGLWRTYTSGLLGLPLCPLWLAFVVGADAPSVSFPQLGPMGLWRTYTSGVLGVSLCPLWLAFVPARVI